LLPLMMGLAIFLAHRGLSAVLAAGALRHPARIRFSASLIPIHTLDE
jgi:hypothetical protein